MGFFFGGTLFQFKGIRGIAVAGMVVLSLEMLSLIFFLVSPPNDVKHDGKEGEANEAKEGTNNHDNDDETNRAMLERKSTLNTVDSGRSTIRKIAESLQSGIVRTTVLG